jgi:hypothetical protein
MEFCRLITAQKYTEMVVEFNDDDTDFELGGKRHLRRPAADRAEESVTSFFCLDIPD